MAKQQSKEFLERKGKIQEINEKFNEKQRLTGGKTSGQIGAEITNKKKKAKKLVLTALEQFFNKSIKDKEGNIVRDEDGNEIFNLDNTIQELGTSKNENIKLGVVKLYADLNKETNENQVVVNNNYNKLTREDIEEFDEMFESNLKDNNEKGTT